MTAYFGILSVLALTALAVEYQWSRARGLDWHDPRDTLANLNLAAGNLVLGTVLVAGTLAIYTAIHSVAPVDVHDHLPSWAVWATGFLLAELLQYWNHRLSHVWNPLVWGHITHHSSPRMNLSTAVRVNWFYRTYAWLFYVPMPLLGFTAFEFVALQTLMNAYNLFQHTRAQVPFGPLEYVLVSPRAHRLHHSADPALAGNYGASLIVFDRMFGTYREVADESTLTYGLPESEPSPNPLTMNFHYLRDLWTSARLHGVSPVAMLLGTTWPETGRAEKPVRHVLTASSWGFGLGLVGVAVAFNATAPRLDAVTVGLGVTTVLAAIIAFGARLERLAPSADEGHGTGGAAQDLLADTPHHDALQR